MPAVLRVKSFFYIYIDINPGMNIIQSMKQYVTPPQYLILLFGNSNRAAKALNYSRQRLHYWKKLGRIPRKEFQNIISKCNVTFDDLVNGRMIETK